MKLLTCAIPILMLLAACGGGGGDGTTDEGNDPGTEIVTKDVLDPMEPGPPTDPGLDDSPADPGPPDSDGGDPGTKDPGPEDLVPLDPGDLDTGPSDEGEVAPDVPMDVPDEPDMIDSGDVTTDLAPETGDANDAGDVPESEALTDDLPLDAPDGDTPTDPGWSCATPQDCDDQDLCTVDLCNQDTGDCEYEALDCDDGCDCTLDSCQPLIGCVYDPAPGCEICETADECDDGDPCTADDCFSACFCVHQVMADCVACLTVDDCDDDNVCTLETCQDDQTCAWDCDDGVQCSDGVDLTIDDHCVEDDSGGCACTGIPVDCLTGEHCDDSNTCTEDLCYGETCWHACLDGQACESGGVGSCRFFLEEGNCVCLAGCLEAGDCDDGDACTLDWCDETTHTCHHECLESLACDDQDPSTTGDVCGIQSGSGCGCIGIPFTCEGDGECSDGNPCTKDVCTGTACTHQCQELEFCDDGDPATGNERCFADEDTGDCTCVGEILGCVVDGDCDDANDCTGDFCFVGECSYQCLSGTECDDGDPGTTSDDCGSHPLHPEVCTCLGRPPCTWNGDCDDGDPCTLDVCDDSGACSTGCLIGSSCDDGNALSMDDSCRFDLSSLTSCGCLGDTPCLSEVECDDGNPCTLDSCNDSGFCEWSCNNSASCDDGDPLTYDTVCQLLTGYGCLCQGPRKHCVEAADCDDENDCTVDTCTPAGECLHECQPGSNCDDGNPFSEGDACVTEGDSCACQGTLECTDAGDCDSGNPCLFDWCDNQGKCHHDCMAKLPCDDGNPLTLWDSCVDGGPGECGCEGMAVACAETADCDDGNQCTLDFCFNFTCLYGCAQEEPCDDDNPYTESDTCVDLDEGGCQCVGDGIDCLSNDECDDGNQCTADLCTDGFCSNDCDAGASCDDGNPYTDPDNCESDEAGGCTCTGPGFDCLYDTECDDADPCTKDVCNEGFCFNSCAVGLACDDANPDSEDDRCRVDEGSGDCLCQGSLGCQTNADCDDGFPCTYDQCSLGGKCQYSCLGATPCNDGDPGTIYDGCKSSPEGECICAGVPAK